MLQKKSNIGRKTEVKELVVYRKDYDHNQLHFIEQENNRVVIVTKPDQLLKEINMVLVYKYGHEKLNTL